MASFSLVDCSPRTSPLFKPSPRATAGSESIAVPLDPTEEVAVVSAAWRKWRIDGGLCEGLKLIGSTTVHLHGLPGKQQADVPMEVDLPRLGTLEPGRDQTNRTRRVSSFKLKRDKMAARLPQMNEVAQGASVGQGLPAHLVDCVAAHRNREGPLAQEGLVPGWHGS